MLRKIQSTDSGTRAVGAGDEREGIVASRP
jgi:hypothetical protein